MIKLKLSADDNGIRLEPVQPSGQLVRKGTLLVFRGEFDAPITNELIETLLDEDRNLPVRDVKLKPRKK